VKFLERIELAGRPFPQPLPMRSSLLLENLASYGYLFKDWGNNRSIFLDDTYEPSRREAIQRIVDHEGWDVSVSQTVWTELSDHDFELAPLWHTYFPDCWIDEIDFTAICRSCKREWIDIDTHRRVDHIKSSKPLLSVNGQFEIVSAEVKAQMESSLVGAAFYPFDQQGRYFYLRSQSVLSPVLVRGDEVLDYNGTCGDCQRPMFRIFFGPLRFPKTCWSGEDVVVESFHNSCLLTPKAFRLLKTFNRRLIRAGLAFLE
jgi:hypothetical protein